jgi:hypothetical protein
MFTKVVGYFQIYVLTTSLNITYIRAYILYEYGNIIISISIILTTKHIIKRTINKSNKSLSTWVDNEAEQI